MAYLTHYGIMISIMNGISHIACPYRMHWSMRTRHETIRSGG